MRFATGYSEGFQSSFVRVSMFERVMCCRVAAGAMVCLAVMFASPARAQSIFSDIFGWVIKPNSPQIDLGDGLSGQFSPRPPNYGGRYRTVGVRMCEGYYFPISQSTSRSSFHRDGERCQARCAGDSRLFYMPTGTVDIDHAIDVTGLAYRSIDNAYRYRKKLVKGCMCRHRPWSPEERARHQMYELEHTQTAQAKGGSSPVGEAVPGMDTKPVNRPNWDSVGRLYAGDFGADPGNSTTQLPYGRSAPFGQRLDSVHGLTKPIATVPRQQPQPAPRPRARKFGVRKLWSDEGH